MSLLTTRAGGVGGAGPRAKACPVGAQLDALQTNDQLRPLTPTLARLGTHVLLEGFLLVLS